MTPVDRLLAATNAHDLDALVGCFTEDYVNETPAHPARGFRGRDQVRRNWEQLFGFIPDLQADVVARAEAGDATWTEWRMHGNRRDGKHYEMRGVIVFGVRDDRIATARFYLEPLDEGGAGIDEVVRRVTAGTP